MKPISRVVRLEYNSFYVAGSRNVQVPAPHGGQHIVANKHCMNVGCRIWHDGEIRIDIGHSDKVAPRGRQRLDAVIETPDRGIVLFDANHPEIALWPVEQTATRIRIYTNHEAEPDLVQVIVGA